jgi:VIT family
MPLTRHVERHFTSGDTVRDIVIGMSDGLTVPFALAAGLSAAVEATSVVITAGLATTVRMTVPSSWVVCGEASTGREAVAKAVGLRPDIVVLDINRIIEP